MSGNVLVTPKAWQHGTCHLLPTHVYAFSYNLATISVIKFQTLHMANTMICKYHFILSCFYSKVSSLCVSTCLHCGRHCLTHDMFYAAMLSSQQNINTQNVPYHSYKGFFSNHEKRQYMPTVNGISSII